MTSKIIIFFIFLSFPVLVIGAQNFHYHKFEIKSISEDKAAICLNKARDLSSKKDKTASDIYSLYESEECLSNYIFGYTPNMPEPNFNSLNIAKTSIRYQCLSYVRNNISRFREIHDGWKGEENIWEPNYYWLDIIKGKYPNSKERWMIEWGLTYKDFIRQFEFSELAKGKTCDEYYEGLIKEYPEHLEYYSKEEIAKIKRDCETKREQYKKSLFDLLDKYKDNPIEKKMYDIDDRNVISNFYFGLC